MALAVFFFGATLTLITPLASGAMGGAIAAAFGVSVQTQGWRGAVLAMAAGGAMASIASLLTHWF